MERRRMSGGKVDRCTSGALVPVVRCEKRTRVRIERALPMSAEVLVQEGERVQATQVIARATDDIARRVYIVDVAGALDLPGRDVSSSMVKQRGEYVRAGELLAVRRSALPFAYRACRSPVDGRLRMVWYGWAVIETDGDTKGGAGEIAALLDGYVVAVVPGSHVTIEAEAACIEGVGGIAGEAYGVLQIVCPPSAAPLMPEHLPEDATGAIVVVDGLISRPALERAMALGVRGVVAAGIPAVTSEVAALPVMATEGYGVQRMAPERLQRFRELEGCYATLIVPAQHTPPWARRRPVVIVPRMSETHPEGDSEERLSWGRPLCPGDRVRVVRAPLAGHWGIVSVAPEDRQVAMPSGVITVGAKVRFSADVVARLPYLNLERIVCT